LGYFSQKKKLVVSFPAEVGLLPKQKKEFSDQNPPEETRQQKRTQVITNVQCDQNQKKTKAKSPEI